MAEAEVAAMVVAAVTVEETVAATELALVVAKVMTSRATLAVLAKDWPATTPALVPAPGIMA